MNDPKPAAIPGIHHVTAIASKPQGNLDFYTQVLGLRLVKTTVNFDDPSTYHLYFGDELGRPGTILTFFTWPSAPRGHKGVGQVISTSFAVPPGAIDSWIHRLEGAGVEVRDGSERFGAGTVAFSDPDGLRLELVESAERASRPPWNGAGVPSAEAIRGICGATLMVRELDPTARLLAAMGLDAFGDEAVAEGGHLHRFTLGRGVSVAHLDLLVQPAGPPGRSAAGTVHHIAFRVPDEESELVWRRRLLELGFDVTGVRDRQYFHSIYFREPGGVLFELATDPPGFTFDEAPDELGSRLKLPSWLEKDRPRIEQLLPELRPAAVGAPAG